MINAYLNTSSSIKIKVSPVANLKANMNNVIAVPNSKSYVKEFKENDWVKDLIYYTIRISYEEHKLRNPHITTFLVNDDDSLQNAVLFYKVLTNNDVVLYADMQPNGICKIEEI